MLKEKVKFINLIHHHDKRRKNLVEENEYFCHYKEEKQRKIFNS